MDAQEMDYIDTEGLGPYTPGIAPETGLRQVSNCLATDQYPIVGGTDSRKQGTYRICYQHPGRGMGMYVGKSIDILDCDSTHASGCKQSSVGFHYTFDKPSIQ